MDGMTNDERLFVLIEARIREFEKNMAKASGISGREFGKIRRDSKSATAAMEADMARSTQRINQALATSATRIGSYGKAFAGSLIGGAIGGLAAGSIVATLRDTARGIAQIGDEAKRAGVSVRAFQEWKFVAEQNRIGIDQMTDGLKELNLRADEFVQTGKGSAAEAFQRLGYNAEDLKKKLEDPSALLLEIIDRLGKMDKAAQIRIADELFGGSAGERFVELIEQGEQGIRDTIDRAHELGVVMDDDLIKKAAELDRKFNAIANTVGTALKSAIVSAADSLAEFIDGFRAFEEQQSSTLSNRMRDLGRERLEVEGRLIEMREKQRRGQGAGDGIFGTSIGESTAGEGIADLERRMEAIAAEEGMINRILENRTPAMSRTADRTWTPPEPPPGGFGSSGSKSTKERADEYERLSKNIVDATAAQVAETEAQRQLNPLVDDYGYAAEKARMERELLTAAEEAGREVTPTLRAEIEALSEQYALAGAEAAKLAEEQAQMVEDMNFRKDIWLGVARDFRSALADGKLEFEELGDIAISVFDKIVDKMLTDVIDAIFEVKNAANGGGGLGGIFGFIGKLLGFGGGGGLNYFPPAPSMPGVGLYAGGGQVRGPGTGTSDSIPAMLSDGEFVVNAKATRKHRGILEAINAGGDFLHRAAGGLVSPLPLPVSATPAPIPFGGEMGGFGEVLK